tara:strand:+ start:198 stop:431 length:234 start_codon:yes stop_codon:yes gene_type:complete
VLFLLKDDDRRREDFVGDAKDDDDDLVDPTRGLVSTNETRDGELQHRREHGTSSFFSNNTRQMVLEFIGVFLVGRAM